MIWAILLITLQVVNGMSRYHKSRISRTDFLDVTISNTASDVWSSMSVWSIDLNIKESTACSLIGSSKLKIEIKNPDCNINKLVRNTMSCSGSCSVSATAAYFCEKPSKWVLRFINENNTPGCDFNEFEATITYKCGNNKGNESDKCKLKLTQLKAPSSVEAGQNFNYGLSIPSGYISNALDVSVLGTQIAPTFVNPQSGSKVVSSSGDHKFEMSYPTVGNNEVCLDLSGVGLDQVSILGLTKCQTISITAVPTAVPTSVPPTLVPTAVPTLVPTLIPTAVPTAIPTAIPTNVPTAVPVPTNVPTAVPTNLPTAVPTAVPTEAPPTAVPTAVPETLIPTAIPVGFSLNIIPSTPIPMKLPQEVYEEQLGASSVITTAAALSGTLPTASTVIASSQPCDLTSPDKKLPFPFHPTRMEISGSIPAGAVVGNFLIFGVCALMGKFILFLFSSKCLPVSIVPDSLFDGFSDVQGMLRFPSAPLFLFLGLYQGTIVAALLLIQSPPDNDIKIIWIAVGVLAVLFCISLPIMIIAEVRKAVPRQAAYNVDYINCPKWKIYWIGDGEWVSVERNNHWINRYASMSRQYVEEYASFSAVQFIMSALIGIAASVSVSGSYCAAIKLIEAIIFLTVFAVCITIKPHARMIENHVVAAIYLIQCTSLMCSAIYFLNDSVPFMDASRVQNYVVMSLILVKVVISIGVEIYVFLTKRRERLQENFWYRLTVLEPLKTEVSLFNEPDELPLVAQKLSFKKRSTMSQHTFSEHGSPLMLSRQNSEALPDYSDQYFFL